jgi:hypothetical protein
MFYVLYPFVTYLLTLPRTMHELAEAEYASVSPGRELNPGLANMAQQDINYQHKYFMSFGMLLGRWVSMSWRKLLPLSHVTLISTYQTTRRHNTEDRVFFTGTAMTT